LQLYCDMAAGLQIYVIQDPSKLISLNVGLQYKLRNNILISIYIELYRHVLILRSRFLECEIPHVRS
jgi:hypothetical protein